MFSKLYTPVNSDESFSTNFDEVKSAVQTMDFALDNASLESASMSAQSDYFGDMVCGLESLTGQIDRIQSIMDSGKVVSMEQLEAEKALTENVLANTFGQAPEEVQVSLESFDALGDEYEAEVSLEGLIEKAKGYAKRLYNWVMSYVNRFLTWVLGTKTGHAIVVAGFRVYSWLDDVILSRILGKTVSVETYHEKFKDIKATGKAFAQNTKAIEKATAQMQKIIKDVKAGKVDENYSTKVSVKFAEGKDLFCTIKDASTDSAKSDIQIITRGDDNKPTKSSNKFRIKESKEYKDLYAKFGIMGNKASSNPVTARARASAKKVVEDVASVMKDLESTINSGDPTEVQEATVAMKFLQSLTADAGKMVSYFDEATKYAVKDLNAIAAKAKEMAEATKAEKAKEEAKEEAKADA